MKEPNEPHEESFFRKNRSLVGGAMTGAAAYVVARSFGNIKLLENTANWLKKHAASNKNQALLSTIEKDLSQIGNYSDYIPDKKAVNAAWEIAEREGFNKRPTKLEKTAFLSVSTAVGAVIGGRADSKRSELARAVSNQSKSDCSR